MARHLKELTFEDALERLEALVGAMERGDVPLAELLSKYADADKLLRRCQGCLADAELKIERLRKDREGIRTEAFEESGAGDGE
jgi:exodeoxyribonuclease VII small subunit